MRFELAVSGDNLSFFDSLATHPGDSDVALEARAKIERPDYGILARYLDPQKTTGGQISLDLDLATRGSEYAHIMNESNGHIDFAIWPRDLDARIFDLWAVNLFTAVLPSLDSTASKVNCLIARFALDDGLMRAAALLIDTSRIQASGRGSRAGLARSSSDLRIALALPRASSHVH